jgi:hypothetical protein
MLLPVHRSRSALPRTRRTTQLTFLSRFARFFRSSLINLSAERERFEIFAHLARVLPLSLPVVERVGWASRARVSTDPYVYLFSSETFRSLNLALQVNNGSRSYILALGKE